MNSKMPSVFNFVYSIIHSFNKCATDRFWVLFYALQTTVNPKERSPALRKLPLFNQMVIGIRGQKQSQRDIAVYETITNMKSLKIRQVDIL